MKVLRPPGNFSQQGQRQQRGLQSSFDKRPPQRYHMTTHACLKNLQSDDATRFTRSNSNNWRRQQQQHLYTDNNNVEQWRRRLLRLLLGRQQENHKLASSCLTFLPAEDEDDLFFPEPWGTFYYTATESLYLFPRYIWSYLSRRRRTKRPMCVQWITLKADAKSVRNKPGIKVLEIYTKVSD